MARPQRRRRKLARDKTSRVYCPGVGARLAVACTIVTALAPSDAAHADGKVRTTAEFAVEVDSNVLRIETTPEQSPTTAEMVRLGGGLSFRSAAPQRGQLALAATAHVRNAVDRQVSGEDLALLGLDGQWTGSVREDQVRIGTRLSYRDAISTGAEDSDRTFRGVSADLVLGEGETSRITVSAGPRRFVYKANDDYSWTGVGVTVRGDVPLWRSGDDNERTLDLLATATVEQRRFRGISFDNVCPPAMDVTPMCFAATSRRRGDRMHRVGVEASYLGPVAASFEVQGSVVDSNSFGQSWLGVRLRAAVTGEVKNWYITGSATVRADRYSDGLLVARNSQQGDYDTLDDDNRSSLELRVARAIGADWAVEARLSIWRDLAAGIEYERSVATFGVVWGH
jgi:hypothetical protein